jgi:excisionase family DNA binding protein
MKQEKIIFSTEAAEILGVNRQRINQLANQGHIGKRVAGRYWVFTRSELERYRQIPRAKDGRRKIGMQPA